jgi:hypothetical protein
VERVRDWTAKLAWPDVTTEDGISRACSIGAAAQAAIASAYAAAFVSILGGAALIGGAANEGGMRIFALSALGAGVLGTSYLAFRIWARGCAIAAWVGLLWIGYENINAMLGITPANSLTLFILLFAALQGVRACTFSVANDR